ncbi:hypothetical protein [Citrobacter braakii]|uniref:hypothetical protein n=1 Tax=Citrobacter braakii TaxID=57706 RepID=UPI0034E4C394
MAKLWAIADWTQSYDSYMEKGVLNIPEKPVVINDKSSSDAMDKNNRYMGRPSMKNEW